MKRFFMVFISSFILFSVSVLAGTQTGTVSQIIVRQSDGLHYFYISGPSSEKPGCASKSYWMIKDESSAAGKDQYALLMMAYSMRAKVRVDGLSTCTRWLDGEDVNTILLLPPSSS
ncbi:hypothetical protein [Gallaecimonas pentaromativorans]|uniref:hypothetical protein n=1 Tax=Gallaecimonas pentaromativorans TaxID=584787 RepID=UPI001FD20B37|nr:hypothetical protein [Gallaecimonas pentaromativorans]